MPDEEKSRELTRSSYAAQMAMLGYEPDGNPKDMVEVVRCKDCGNRECDGRAGTVVCGITGESHSRLWFCADGERR